MEQSEFNSMLIEALKSDEVQSQFKEMVSEAKALRGSQAVRDFRAEMAKWVQKTAESTAHVNQNGVQSGLYGALRAKLDIKSMNGLEDSQLDKAREIFEQYKELVA